jgi:hypothetical protein
MIPFAGSYTKEQWSRGLRVAMHPTGRNLIVRLLGLAVILLFVGFIAYNLFQGEAVNWGRLARSAVSVLLLGAWVSTPYVRAWRAAAEPWRGTDRHPSLKGVITNEGIISNASASGAVDKWDRCLRAFVRDDMVVLVGSDGLATLLPRTFFATEDDWQQFRQLVQFNVIPPR